MTEQGLAVKGRAPAAARDPARAGHSRVSAAPVTGPAGADAVVEARVVAKELDRARVPVGGSTRNAERRRSCQGEIVPDRSVRDR